ncbi:MAG: hypothetical protein AB7I50_22960 [Vicinamibacterales bacterium]
MSEIECQGLDGTSLLGFLAGLGTLEALGSTAGPGEPVPRLRWAASGGMSAALSGPACAETLARLVVADAQSEAVSDVLSFKYVKREKAGLKLSRALSPPVAVLRAALAARLGSGRAVSADTLGTLMSETATEELPDAQELRRADLEAESIDCDPDFPLNVAASPTPFDFTSRNTQFLDQIRRVRDALTDEVVLRDLFQGEGTPIDRIMRWDALVDMPGALFDRARPMTRPASEWLAFRAISYFPLVADRGRARMYGMTGRRKAGEFSWVLWDAPLRRCVVRSLLATRWAAVSSAERAARGVIAGFTVELRKDATGYDGAVSPSRPLGSAIEPFGTE